MPAARGRAGDEVQAGEAGPRATGEIGTGSHGEERDGEPRGCRTRWGVTGEPGPREHGGARDGRPRGITGRGATVELGTVPTG